MDRATRLVLPGRFLPGGFNGECLVPFPLPSLRNEESIGLPDTEATGGSVRMAIHGARVSRFALPLWSTSPTSKARSREHGKRREALRLSIAWRGEDCPKLSY